MPHPFPRLVKPQNCERVSLGPAKTYATIETPGAISDLDLSQLAIYSKYRGHPLINEKDHQALLRQDLTTSLNAGGLCTGIVKNTAVQAVCALRPLEWDSKHFGTPMASLTVAASRGCNENDLAGLLTYALSLHEPHSSGLHVSCEIDIDDYTCLNTLLGLGANILDLKREYRCTSLSRVRKPKFLSRVRAYHASDKTAVMALLDQSAFETRFSRDQALSAEKTASMYRLWLERLLDTQDEDRIAMIMERGADILACGAIERRDFSASGIDLQIMNGGIYISSPVGTGGYYPILYSLIAEAEDRGMTSQTCVSLNNHAATRVLERMNVGTASARYALRLLI